MSAIHFRMRCNKICVCVSVFFSMCLPIIEFNSNRSLFTNLIWNGFRWAFRLAHTQSVKSNEWMNKCGGLWGGVMWSLNIPIEKNQPFPTDDEIVVILFCQNIDKNESVVLSKQNKPKIYAIICIYFHSRAPHTWNVYLSSLVWLSPFCGWWMSHFSARYIENLITLSRATF